MMWAMLALACACGRAPSVPGDAARDAPSREALPGSARVTADAVEGVDEARPAPARWVPPPVALPPEADRGQWRRQAEQALEEGRLYQDAQAAVPIYLALLQADPDDAVARRGLQRAQGAVVAAGTQALAAAAGGDDEQALRRARQLAAVAQALDPADEAVGALAREVERAQQVAVLAGAGEAQLRAGQLGEAGEGALAWFRNALALAPGDARARQGVAAVESAMLDRAEAAARALDFDEAERWLAHARATREDEAGAVADARHRVDAVRSRHVAMLRDAALSDLLRPGGLRDARARLAEVLRIAPPGDPVAVQLRERVVLFTHYGAFRPGQVFTDALADGSRGPQMAVVPHGAFRMGAEATDPLASDAEQPAHYVRFDRGFAMSLTEVTVAEFGRFVELAGARPRATRRGNSIVYDERSGNFVRRSGVDWRSGYDGRPAAPGDPVLHVSVRDAEAYAAWLSEQTGRHYRLPSEAEFEYALRAGSPGRYPWGDAGLPPENSGNFTGGNDVSPSGRTWNNAFVGYGDGYWGVAPVGRFQANAWGLHDLAGNVSEWVGDCWHASYRRAPADGAAWFNPGCRTRVVRGGSWAGSPVQTRSAWRSRMDSDITSGRIGFRLVRGI
ncbi:serine/threonine kinase [Pseudoxanthomonas broegbernensis]|uniref:Serine/threonine kinase n=1 Tax=Pseudoxanthomonas broegbernensis TaxID=83619 RepID=A0A7V8GPW9_9GAMM|nr:SUMF1/EgtB/PvdO family nonheme iron enzyme [Pseudoxanthomonas broegbernensis]KAF1687956.1 serine/threonine kinase [Pseudoxanthomonas broegbernensis]